jgi:O-antigen/teichoic acid export membrane protein
MLLRNSLLNLIGLGGPLLAAIFTIPYLIAELGPERFGLLTLIWAVVSYFGLFDFGLGRALTQQIAITWSRDENHDIPSITGTAYLIMLVLGLCAGLIMALVAPFLVEQIKNIPNNSEAINALYAMAVAMPFIVLTSGFRGVLEARQAFGIINLIRIPMGLFTFIGPAAVVWFDEPRLDLIAWVLAIGRVLGCLIHAWFASRSLPKEYRALVVKRTWVRPLCVNGGWLTVSNVISPLMSYVDRFLIGALVSTAAVTYYATPNEIVTKLWIFPAALTAVLFPTFAAQISSGGGEARKLFKKVLLWLFLAMAPIVFVLIVFAHDIMRLWISEDFANQSATILRIFAAGILINSLTHIPFTLIQSSGHARLTALIHLVEFPMFMGALWWFTINYGVEGAAWAWLLRIIFDTGLMFACCKHVLDSRVVTVKYS